MASLHCVGDCRISHIAWPICASLLLSLMSLPMRTQPPQLEGWENWWVLWTVFIALERARVTHWPSSRDRYIVRINILVAWSGTGHSEKRTHCAPADSSERVRPITPSVFTRPARSAVYAEFRTTSLAFSFRFRMSAAVSRYSDRAGPSNELMSLAASSESMAEKWPDDVTDSLGERTMEDSFQEMWAAKWITSTCSIWCKTAPLVASAPISGRQDRISPTIPASNSAPLISLRCQCWHIEEVSFGFPTTRAPEDPITGRPCLSVFCEFCMALMEGTMIRLNLSNRYSWSCFSFSIIKGMRNRSPWRTRTRSTGPGLSTFSWLSVIVFNVSSIGPIKYWYSTDNGDFPPDVVAPPALTLPFLTEPPGPPRLLPPRLKRLFRLYVELLKAWPRFTMRRNPVRSFSALSRSPSSSSWSWKTSSLSPSDSLRLPLSRALFRDLRKNIIMILTMHSKQFYFISFRNTLKENKTQLHDDEGCSQT